MTRILSLSPLFVAFTLVGAVACSPAVEPELYSVTSSTVDLALVGSSENITAVHVLLKPSVGRPLQREVTVDANATNTATLQVEPGEHVMAIVCTNEAGDVLLGTGTATFQTQPHTNLMILVDVDSLIDGEEVPPELIEEIADAQGEESGASGDDDNEDGTNIDADVDVNVGEDGADADADVASGDASAGIALMASAESNAGANDSADTCDEACQAQCLEELLALCGF
jgi:hypothetical protein